MPDRMTFPGENVFREFWHFHYRDTSPDALDESLLKLAPKILLPAIAIFLVLTIGFVSYLIYKRSEQGMSELLAEKGSSLLNVMESALRTGMRGTAGLQLQVLLEEIAREPDIELVAVTLPEGTIIAHSDKGRLGEIMRMDGDYMNWNRMAELDPGEKEKWLMTTMNGERIFLVYRNFTVGSDNWNPDLPKPTIFLGLTASAFEITNSQNRSFVAILTLAIMMITLCALLAMSQAQRAMESRRRQRDAEGQVHKLEEEVRRNEKLAAVGTLAAGVAHEIRNPLSSIKGYATYFMQRFGEGTEDREAASVMVREVERLNRVITDLIGLSRPSDVKLRPIHIENVVKHVIRLLQQNVSGKGITLTTHFAPVIDPVMGDRERLSQALLNLCLNAIEAMPTGGRLDIAVAGGKKTVCLIVSDTGCGMEKEIMDKIFDPYFTTKGTGTGLGLPMVHKIIKAHGGRIRARSRVANGCANPGRTVFMIWLPLADLPAR